MEEKCEKCGKTISKRAVANIWEGRMVVCTPCRNDLISDQKLAENQIKSRGIPGSLWHVRTEQNKKIGPLEGHELIRMLRTGRISFDVKVWREGMQDWKHVVALFTVPQLSPDGKIRLRSLVANGSIKEDILEG